MDQNELKNAKWRRWVEVACHDCGNLMLSRKMFLDIQKMISKNPPMQQSDYFHEYLKDTYIAHVLMMLRKHVKIDSKSISLAGLTQDIIKNPQFTSPDHSPEKIQSKFENFKKCATWFEQYADRVIAHNDTRPPEITPTYNQIHEAIDAMDQLCIQCSLATGCDYNVTCEPAVQYGWLMIFRDMGIDT